MDASNVNGQPLAPPVSATVNPDAPPPPPMDPSASTVIQKRPLNPILIGVILIVFFLVAAFTGVYFVLIAPKQAAFKFIGELTPQITALKISTKSVRNTMDRIHLLITQEVKLTSPPPLETSGVFIHPNLASLTLETNILGLSTTRDLSLVEKAVDIIAENIKGTIKFPRGDEDKIAGIKTVSEDLFTSKLRELKEETIKNDQYIPKAQSDLMALLKNSASPPRNISKSARDKIIASAKIQEKEAPFLAEAQKISNYYKILSDTLIAMNTKINSFQVAFASTGRILSNAEESADIPVLTSKITQAQVFLDQAKKDTEEIKKLSETLKNQPKESLPKASDEYHSHNIKVLDTVTVYFTSVSGLLQSLISTTNIILAKGQNGELTRGDMRSFYVVTLDIDKTGDEADTRFTSDLQTLLGEETTLTLSFWQNNSIVSTVGLVEAEIDNYEKTLNKLKEENRVPLLTK